ncbi:ankyrin repeat domain-containing protein [Paenibacillus harenae]|uniref:Ankyrin repeat protein n=1 Tax=Paenibacillus harenae TaxID=306543 RepID=A0ABT9U993_PAEHA|nr:ankyrin repeat domain-containing protein [Paenibacillus harenae]MDQ0115827.1 ankyrin repeat protein [Paenibacillus harenae]
MDEALFTAVLQNDYSKVRLLLLQGADANFTNEMGITPLIAAALHENMRIVYILIQCGVDIERTDRNGATALDYAIRHGRTAMVRLLNRLLSEQNNRV